MRNSWYADDNGKIKINQLHDKKIMLTDFVSWGCVQQLSFFHVGELLQVLLAQNLIAIIRVKEYFDVVEFIKNVD